MMWALVRFDDQWVWHPIVNFPPNSRRWDRRRSVEIDELDDRFVYDGWHLKKISDAGKRNTSTRFGEDAT